MGEKNQPDLLSIILLVVLGFEYLCAVSLFFISTLFMAEIFDAIFL